MGRRNLAAGNRGNSVSVDTVLVTTSSTSGLILLSMEFMGHENRVLIGPDHQV